MPHTNQLQLQHPSGARVVLLGTTHVSGLHGCFVADAITALQPQSVVLEVDEDRYEQLKFRLAYLLHHDTASLMALTADDDDDGAAHPASSLTPAALRWSQHKQQFCLMRNEGVPLLLGSLYGSDLLQAALAATLGLQQPAAVVLADQEQQLTLARFRLLADGLGPLQQLVAAAVAGIAGVARAEALTMPASEQLPQLACSAPSTSDSSSSSSSSSDSVFPQQPGSPQSEHNCHQHQYELAPVLAAAVQLAAARIFHLFLQWWSMALSSQAEWYGQQVHPVFLLAEADSSSGARQLQQRLVHRGVEGVAEAAAAAARLLDAAAAGGSGGACRPAVAAEDVAAIRRCIESMERVAWQQGSGSGEPPAGDEQQQQHLLPVRPWWVALSQAFSSAVGGSAATAVGGVTGAAGQQGHHANFAAAAAYERAVMAERNTVLADALWQQAAEAGGGGRAARAVAAARAVEDAPVVVGVVGVNHLPGIALEWQLKQQQWQQQQQQHALLPGSRTAASSGAPPPWPAAHDAAAGSAAAGQLLMLSHAQVAATDAAASVIELLAAGAAGLGFVSALNRGTRAPAAAAAASSSAGRFAWHSGPNRSSSSSSMRLLQRSPGLRRFGLLLLPVCVSLLPLQRDAGRMQEAAGLMSHVAAVNDEMMDSGHWGSGAAAMMQLVQQQQQQQQQQHM